MNSNPLISVIMNCYNSSSYLREAIESVIDQTYANWEIIFWDNQSTDESAAIFKSYDDNRLKYFYAPEHKNLSSARNLAVEKINGEYIAFLDCDDVWEPEKLEIQVKSFMNNQAVGIVYSPFEVLLNSDNGEAQNLNTFYSKFKYKSHGPKDIYDVLLVSNYIIFSTVMIRKATFNTTGGFTENLVQNEDYEILLKCASQSLAVCTDKILVKYRIHATNNSFQNSERNFIENRIIYAKLPSSQNVKKAIDRNEIRYGLFKLVYLKKINGLNLFFRSGTFSIICEIFYKRYIKN